MRAKIERARLEAQRLDEPAIVSSFARAFVAMKPAKTPAKKSD